MIKKILLFTSSFLGIYFLVLIFLYPNWKPNRSYWQENIVIGEDYLYEMNSKKIVIVGSSFGVPMKNNFLPELTYNLSLTGMSIFSGLEIIKKSNSSPEVIFIEINHFDRSPDFSLSEKMFSPYSYYSKRYFNFCREKNNSYSLYFYPLIGRIGKFITTGDFNVNDNIPKSFNKEYFNSQLNKFIDEFGKSPDRSKLISNIKLLKNYESYFKKRNCRFVFFETPMDERVSNSTLLLESKKILYSYFPQKSYLYFQDKNTDNYLTTDGAHMDDSSAIRFTHFLNSQFKVSSFIAYPNNNQE